MNDTKTPTLFDLSRSVKSEHPIILAEVDGRIMELYHHVIEHAHLRFLDTSTPIGHLALERTILFSMLKAFYSCAGAGNVKAVSVDFQIQDALFIRPEGNFILDEKLLERVSRKMTEYANRKYPIVRTRMMRNEAIREFIRLKMDAKARLFRYRLSGTVHIYSLGNFIDYFYGPMAPDAGYADKFGLLPYDNGFFLLTPRDGKVSDFDPARHRKEYEVLQESHQWAAKLECEDVADLNQWICQGKAQQLIFIQEALQEKKIGQIAEEIVRHPEKKVVMIAGPSSSSKTTFAQRLCVQLQALGMHPYPISTDDYFVDREKSPKEADGTYNFEKLECVDLKLLNNDLTRLLAGQTVDMPTYNFVQGRREYHGRKLQLKAGDILVIEGIHCFNDKLTYALPAAAKFKICISALSQLAIDMHNPIPPADGRLIRRLVRDARTRGTSASQTMAMWPKVRAGEEDYIFPYMESADVFFNSACVYELAVLKPYVEPLLFTINETDPNYPQARRLLKFLDYFLGISSEDVPKNSLLREFIG